MKQFFKKILRKAGYDLVSFDARFNMNARKIFLLRNHTIDHVLDVGANTGQFGQYCRSMAYTGKITSFEPMADAYAKLEQAARSDPRWTAVHAGLGAGEAKVPINISRNSFSSSIKTMLPRHADVHPDSAVVAQETIQIYALDSVFDAYVKPTDCVMLKIDTQGFESEVLAGAARSLDKIDLVVLEMSVEPLYENQELLPAMLTKLQALGYKPAILEPCDEDYDTTTILQMDGWFIKSR